MLDRLKKLIASKRFLYAVIALFAVQALFLSVRVPYKAPSDEEYHFRLTDIYSERSLLAGPVIADQVDNFNLGDIQRPPGYLYHYVSSFFLKVIKLVVHSTEGQVLALRVLNVGLGVLALCLLVRLLQRLGARGITINLTVAWLAITAMFVWVFAAVNYDNLAIMLFFALLNVFLSLYHRVAADRLVWSGILSLALMLTKETYLPSIAALYILLLVWWLRKYGWNGIVQKIWASLQQSVRTNQSRTVLVSLTLLLVVFGGMFVERYGYNYLHYKKTTPACNQVHTEAECLNNSIYRRNTGQKREYELYKQNGGQPSMTHTQYAVTWVRLIYERTYFFRGQATTNPTWQARLVASITAPILLLLMVLGLRRNKYSAAHVALAITTILYVLLVFFYNLNSYVYYGYPFAIQGRYLLPVLPFIYFFGVQAMMGTYHQLRIRNRKALVAVLLVLLVVNMLFHLPLMIYRQKGYLLQQPITRITGQSDLS